MSNVQSTAIYTADYIRSLLAKGLEIVQVDKPRNYTVETYSIKRGVSDVDGMTLCAIDMADDSEIHSYSKRFTAYVLPESADELRALSLNP